MWCKCSRLTRQSDARSRRLDPRTRTATGDDRSYARRLPCKHSLGRTSAVPPQARSYARRLPCRHTLGRTSAVPPPASAQPPEQQQQQPALQQASTRTVWGIQHQPHETQQQQQLAAVAAVAAATRVLTGSLVSAAVLGGYSTTETSWGTKPGGRCSWSPSFPSCPAMTR